MSLVPEERVRLRRAIGLLGRIDSRHPDLPAITWDVSQWALIGRPDTTLPPAEGRAVFEAWVAALGLNRWTGRPLPSGGFHVHAVGQDYDGTHLNVVMMADLYDDFSEEGR